jgi:hypothetical protein
MDGMSKRAELVKKFVLYTFIESTCSAHLFLFLLGYARYGRNGKGGTR